MKSVADLPAVTAAVLDAVARGEMTPSEAQAVAGLVEVHRRACELGEIEARFAAIEAQIGGGKKR